MRLFTLYEGKSITITAGMHIAAKEILYRQFNKYSLTTQHQLKIITDLGKHIGKAEVYVIIRVSDEIDKRIRGLAYPKSNLIIFEIPKETVADEYLTDNYYEATSLAALAAACNISKNDITRTILHELVHLADPKLRMSATWTTVSHTPTKFVSEIYYAAVGD